MSTSIFAKLRKLGASATEARKAAEELKNLNKKPTQDIFKKKFKQILSSRVDKDTGGKQTTADLVGTRGEKVTVTPSKIDKGFIEASKTKGSMDRAKKKVALQDKKRDKTITAKEKETLKKMEKADIEATRKQGGGQRGKAKPDDFKTAQKMLEDTGEMGAAFERLTKNEQDRLIKSTKIKQMLKKKKEMPSDEAKAKKKLLQKQLATDPTRRANMNKGGLKMPTADQTGLKKLPTAVRNKMGYMYGGGMAKKPRTGSMDYRKGGLLIISIDMKKKKKGK